MDQPPRPQHIYLFDVVVDDEGPDKGKRFTLSLFLSDSLHEKSNLRKVLRSWRGADFSPEERAKPFDPEVVVGKQARVTVAHVTKSDGSVYAKIISVNKPLPGQPRVEPEMDPTVPPDWVKKIQDRQIREDGNGGTQPSDDTLDQDETWVK
jgi:hypothetical protein